MIVHVHLLSLRLDVPTAWTQQWQTVVKIEDGGIVADHKAKRVKCRLHLPSAAWRGFPILQRVGHCCCDNDLDSSLWSRV